MAGKQQIMAVWEAWRARQVRPNLCRFSDARETLIKKALKYCSVEDLTTLFAYAWESDDRLPSFWRGEVTGRKYLGIEQLLGPVKLASRVEDALKWREDIPRDQGGQDTDEEAPTLNRIEQLREQARAVRGGRKLNGVVTFGRRSA